MMKTYLNIQLRRFPVQIKDERTGIISEDKITFTKSSSRQRRSWASPARS